jgi:DNA-binding MarR family transcriptional regulator
MKRRFLACILAAGAALSTVAYCPAPAAAPLDRAGPGPAPAAAGTSLRPGTGVRVQRTPRRGAKLSLTSKRRRAIGEGAPIEVKNTGRASNDGPSAVPAVLRQLRIVLRAIRNHDERSTDGISAARLRALALIESRPGLQVGEFAQELGVHQSTASNMLEHLARQGLVEKRRNGDDHRAVSLMLTARAQEILSASPNAQTDAVQQALDRLPPSTVAALQERLADLIRNLPAGKTVIA